MSDDLPPIERFDYSPRGFKLKQTTLTDWFNLQRKFVFACLLFESVSGTPHALANSDAQYWRVIEEDAWKEVSRMMILDSLHADDFN